MYSAPLAAIRPLSLELFGVSNCRVTSLSDLGARVTRTLILPSSTDSTEVSRNLTLLRSPKKFLFPPSVTTEPVAMAPLVITTMSPDCTSSTTRHSGAWETGATTAGAGVAATCTGGFVATTGDGGGATGFTLFPKGTTGVGGGG